MCNRRSRQQYGGCSGPHDAKSGGLRMSTNYIVGEIPGQPVGTTYESRDLAMAAGIHHARMRGIAGNRITGAVSVVVNGGYEEDIDLGDVILYTGAGGRDPNSGSQVADQKIDSNDNAALVVSEENGSPVRVLRGARGNASYAPSSGYRYDGLYRVDSHEALTGKSGFRVWRFKLVRLSVDETSTYDPDPETPTAAPPAPGSAERRVGVVQRVVRSTAVTNYVKQLYDSTCQVCDVPLALPVGRYAEGAHLQALGHPHHGPDRVENVLCLCPNHHAQLDYGALYLDDSLRVRDLHGNALGQLTVKDPHQVGIVYVREHRRRFGFA